MALDFKVGTYKIRPADSPIVVTKSDAQAMSIKLSTKESAGTIKGSKNFKNLVSVPIDLTFGTPVSIGKGLGFEEITINITAGAAELMII